MNAEDVLFAYTAFAAVGCWARRKEHVQTGIPMAVDI